MPSKVSPVTVRCRPPDAGVPGVEMRGESVLQPGVTRPGNARAEPLPGVLPLNLMGVLNSSAPAVPRLPRLGWRVIVSIIAREGDGRTSARPMRGEGRELRLERLEGR